jgi:hypothetical protein
MNGKTLDKKDAALFILLTWAWIPVLAMVLGTMIPWSVGFWVVIVTMCTFATAGGIVLGQVIK